MRSAHFRDAVGRRHYIREDECDDGMFFWDRNHQGLRFRVLEDGGEVWYEVPASNIKFLRETK